MLEDSLPFAAFVSTFVSLKYILCVVMMLAKAAATGGCVNTCGLGCPALALRKKKRPNLP